MKLFELTTGFIAAVAVALGATFYVNAAKVEEEPVVNNKVETSKVQDIRCFEFNNPLDPNNQTPGSLSTADNYNESTLSCPTQREILCGICFDIENYPLDNEKPDFTENPELLQLILDNVDNPVSNHDVEIPGMNGWVKLYFRAEYQ